MHSLKIVLDFGNFPRLDVHVKTFNGFCTECIIPYLARDILLYGACCQYRILHVALVMIK